MAKPHGPKRVQGEPAASEPIEARISIEKPKSATKAVRVTVILGNDIEEVGAVEVQDVLERAGFDVKRVQVQRLTTRMAERAMFWMGNSTERKAAS